MAEYLPVIVEIDEERVKAITATEAEQSSKGFLDSFKAANDNQMEASDSKSFIGLRPLPIDKLQKNLKDFCSMVNVMLTDVQQVGQFKLSEITLSVEISSEGGIQLVGTGKVGGKGAITLKFAE